MVIDLEHILPKGRDEFGHLIFTITNLNIACKRCNMKIKKARTDFLYDLQTVAQDHNNSIHYKFIHPNCDNYFEHISVYQIIENDKKLIKYKVIGESEKGIYTYNYFKLDELEIDTINRAQGMEEKTILSNKINSEIIEELNKILKAI